MDRGNVGAAGAGVQLIQHRLYPLGIGQVVAGGKGMLGVQAYLQTGAVHGLQDSAEFVEFGPDMLSHSGHVLHGQVGPVGRGVQHRLDGVHGLGQHRLVAPATVDARMKYDAGRANAGRQSHVLGQGVDALLQIVLVGVPRFIR